MYITKFFSRDAPFYTLKTDVSNSSEMPLYIYQTTRRYIPQDRNFDNYRYDNLKLHVYFSYKIN